MQVTLPHSVAGGIASLVFDDTVQDSVSDTSTTSLTIDISDVVESFVNGGGRRSRRYARVSWRHHDHDHRCERDTGGSGLSGRQQSDQHRLNRTSNQSRRGEASSGGLAPLSRTVKGGCRRQAKQMSRLGKQPDASFEIRSPPLGAHLDMPPITGWKTQLFRGTNYWKPCVPDSGLRNPNHLLAISRALRECPKRCQLPIFSPRPMFIDSWVCSVASCS